MLLIGVPVVAGIAVGTWAIIEASQTDDLAVATQWVMRPDRRYGHTNQPMPS